MKSSDLSGLGQRLSQLANFLENGVPLREGVVALAQAETAPGIKRTLAVLSARLKQGAELHEAFAAAGLVLPPAPAGAPLEGDRLVASLQYLARHYRARGRIRSLLRRALAYPVVLAAGLLALAGLYTVVVLPRTEQFFMELQAPVPWLAQVALSQHDTLWSAALAALVGLALLRWARPGWFAVTWFAFPGLARILRHLAACEVLSTLALRLRCGEAPTLALRGATAAVDNAWFRARLRRARPGEDADLGVHDTLTRGSLLKGTEGLALAAAERRGDDAATLAETASDVITDLHREVERMMSVLGPICVIILVGVTYMLFKTMATTVMAESMVSLP